MSFVTNIKKISIVLLAVFIIIFALSAPYSTRNIDKLAYVIALGLDVGTDNNLKLTIQLSKPENDSSGSSGGSYKNIVDSVECSSIDSGISLFNSYISKRINLSHCKVLVISEELAAKGVSDYIFTLMNNVEMNPHASIIISKTPANEFIDSAQPQLEDLASRYYEIALSSSNYTGYTQNVSLIRFFSDCVDTFTEPVAMLGSIDDMPIVSNENIENMGLAIFKDGKFVGELSAQESIWHMIISNNLKSCTISVPNPIGDSDSIDLNLKLATDCKNSIKFVNGTPYVSSKVNLKAKITSTTQESTSGDTNYYTKENIELIENSCNEYFEKNITDYLYKMAKEYTCDIDGFGKHAVKYFTTIQDWNEYNWLGNFQNSTFNVDVDTTIKSGYSFL